jgi:hypothetical protein
VLKEVKEHRVPKELKVRLELRELREVKGLKGLKVQQEE